MSRSFLGFLLFCLLLVLASAGVIWYVGPTLAGIVFDEARRGSPYYLLHLLPASDAAGAEADPYRTRFLTLAAEDAGQLSWQGGGCAVVEGSVTLDVASAQVVAFATGADLVQMLTSTRYRSLAAETAAVDESSLLLGTPVAPGSLSADAASVLVLYRQDDQAPDAALGVPGDSGWLSQLPAYGGAVKWRSEVETIRGGSPWNQLLLLQFPSVAVAEGWLEDPETVTERTLAGKHIDRFTVVLIQPSGFSLRQASR